MGDTQKRYKAGETILRQGEKGDCAYIIESGLVEIVMEHPNGRAQRVGTRGPGAMIGEMAIVDAAPRTATVRALEDCALLEITKEDFTRRLNNADPVVRMTTQVILTRYRDAMTRAEITREASWMPTEKLELGYVSQTQAAMEGIKLANDLKNALAKKELSLHYQPIVNLKTGAVAGFEALMRWTHPTRGFISPAIFIPVAEETGLIVEASRWALDEACRALKRIEEAAGYNRELFMSVNFSSSDFASEEFINDVYKTISETDVDPKQVHLEITERLLIQQPDNARETLGQCRKAGMSIAIDDFGTGYSSLSYLHFFPIDTLKIDQSFVRDMRKNENSMELVKSIIALGKNMKMKIIAEGVETAEEGKTLRDQGCEMAQGYYFAKPMPEKDVILAVQSWERGKLLAS